MKIIFMGTPEFAAESLSAIYAAGHDICGVFTQPDKKMNRGMKLSESPVKKFAVANSIPVFQPTSLRDGEALEIIKNFSPELIVVVAYGRILPVEILEYPKYGCINVHASLLPKYRGAAPIQWSVLNGDKVTGVSTMYMAEELDAGDVIDSVETEILPDETYGELQDRLAPIGAKLLVKTVEEISKGTVSRVPQNLEEVTFAPPLSKEMSPIDWNVSSEEICNKVRGLSPWPSATAMILGREFKVHSVEVTEEVSEHVPGTPFADKKGLKVVCGDRKLLRIRELQTAGKKRMSSADYLRGQPLESWKEC